MRQIISTNPTNIEANPNSQVSFNVVYNTEPQQNVSGLGLRLHFDSTALTFDSASNVLNQNQNLAPQVQADTADHDGDPNTDSYILASWVDTNLNWPGDGNLPTTLYTANFTTAETFESTKVNFTASATANGFDLDAVSVAIPDFPPIVANPITDVVAQEDRQPEAIPLSDVFSDANGDDIRIFAQSSNRDVVQTTISLQDGKPNLLNLHLQPNASGIAEIILTGTANGKEVTDTFTVNVQETNDPPTIDDKAFLILENTANSTEVGKIIVNNPDGLENIAFAIADATNIDLDGDGIKPFAISPTIIEQTNTATIIVTDRDDLDFEQQSKFDLEVIATDGSGAEDKATVSVNLTDIPLVENEGIFTVEKVSNFSFDFTAGESDFVNELGLFTVDDKLGTIDGIKPGEEGYLAKVFSRSQSLLAVLSKLPEGFDSTNIKNVTNLQPGTNFGLYFIPNDTSDRVKAQLAGTGNTSVDVHLSTEDNLFVTDREEGGYQIAWEESILGDDNIADFKDLEIILHEDIEQTPVFARNSENPELLDLRQINANTVEFKMTLHREALFENEVALYEVDNMNGGIEVTDSLTGETKIINPTVANQNAYLAAALDNLVISTRFTVGNGETATSESRELETGKIYAPILQSIDSNGKLNHYTPFLATNPDRQDHVRSLGDNLLGFEDIFSGGDLDYNDLVVEFEFM